MNPDMPELLAHAIEAGATNPPGKSRLHGETHWKAVALTELFIARMTPGASMLFLYTFALLHDVCRLNDSNPGDPDDSGHGDRAALLFAKLVMRFEVEGFAPYSLNTEDMMYALGHHVGTPHAREHPNPNVGICWDADRLNLWRVGIEPDPDYMTTEVGRSLDARNYGYLLCEHQVNGGFFPTWTYIRRLMETYRWP